MKERRTKGDGEVGDGEVGRWGDLVYARWHGNNVVMAVHSSAGKTRWNCDSHVTSGWCYVPRVLCTEFQFCVKTDEQKSIIGVGIPPYFYFSTWLSFLK